MFFRPTITIERPGTPQPSFILTDTSSTLELENSPGASALSRSLETKLKHLKKSVGEDHPDVAHTLSSLGDACTINEDHDEAMQLYTQALDVAKRAFPKGHPKSADILCSIGNVCMKLSMFAGSKSSFNAALEIYRRAFTDRSWSSSSDGIKQQLDYNLHHKIASALASLGSVEFQEKNYNAAHKLFQDALLDAKRAAVTGVALDRIKTKGSKEKSEFLKEARIFVTEMFNNVASVCAERGDKSAAIKNYNSALALQMQELGEDHISVACTLHNIGTMHFRSGEYQFALKSYKQVLKMRRYLFGNEDFSIAECLLNIAAVHEKADEFDRGVSALNAAYRITAKHRGKDSMQCADIHACLGSSFARKGCDALALEYYEEALATFTVPLGLSDSDEKVKSIKYSINFVKNADSKEDTMTGFLSAAEAWSGIFGNGCGSFCIPSDSQTQDWNVSNIAAPALNPKHGLGHPSAMIA
jgi:tetratricopeptide (TPR) repeat protein